MSMKFGGGVHIYVKTRLISTDPPWRKIGGYFEPAVVLDEGGPVQQL